MKKEEWIGKRIEYRKENRNGKAKRSTELRRATENRHEKSSIGRVQRKKGSGQKQIREAQERQNPGTERRQRTEAERGMKSGRKGEGRKSD